MKKLIFFLIIVIILSVTLKSIYGELLRLNDTTFFNTETNEYELELVDTGEILLDNGGTFKRTPDNLSLIIKKGDKPTFIINSTTPLYYVGNISKTHEWEYRAKGYDIISSSEELELIDRYYICHKNKTTEKVLMDNGKIKVTAKENPDCIEYKPIIQTIKSKNKGEEPAKIDLVTRTKIDEHTFIVNWDVDYYDPIEVNLTGDCSGTVTITGQEYIAVMTEGVLTSYKTYHDGYTLEWVGGSESGSGNNMGDLYDSQLARWVIDSVIDVNCVLTNYTHSVNMYITSTLDSAAHNNWTFFGTYQNLVSNFDQDFRTYFTLTGDGTYSGYHEFYDEAVGYHPTDGLYHATTSNGGASAWDSNPSTNKYFFADSFDYSKTTSWDYRGRDTGAEGYMKIAHGRTNAIPANSLFSINFTILERNTSSIGDQQFITMVNCFMTNVTCNSTAVNAETPSAEDNNVTPTLNLFLNGTEQNITIADNLNFSVYYYTDTPECFVNLTRNMTTISNNTNQGDGINYWNFTAQVYENNSCNNVSVTYFADIQQYVPPPDPCDYSGNGDYILNQSCDLSNKEIYVDGDFICGENCILNGTSPKIYFNSTGQYWCSYTGTNYNLRYNFTGTWFIGAG